MYVLDSSLKKIAHGTGTMMLGMSIGLVFQFSARPIIARYGTEASYGVFSLALAILNFVVMLACLGLYEGVTIYIARFRADGKPAKALSAVNASLILATIASLVLSIFLFFSADFIALRIFNAAELAVGLRIFAVGVPFFALLYVVVAILRGFDKAEGQAYFQNVLLNVLFLLLLLVAVCLGLKFISVFYGYVAALFLALLGLVLYAVRALPFLRFGQTEVAVMKDLFGFSLPFLGIGVLSLTLLWADTLLLGYFKTADVVGLYNAASPLAQFITQPLGALLVIYTPVIAGLHSQNRLVDLRRDFMIVTKWLTFITMPLFLVLCLFPEAVLNLLFGASYVAAAPALRILSICFMVRNFFGPNGHTLFAMGKSRFVMWSVLLAAIVNVLLNVTLIPPLGMIGAAVALTVSLTLSSAIVSVRLYKLCRAQPLSLNLLKPVVASVVLAVLFRFLAGDSFAVSWWMLLLLFVLYYVMYGIVVLLTRSFDKEDIALLLDIEKRSGINAAPIKKVLARFVRL
jgi:O-antigen/teichoic acid export membrane protein